MIWGHNPILRNHYLVAYAACSYDENPLEARAHSAHFASQGTKIELEKNIAWAHISDRSGKTFLFYWLLVGGSYCKEPGVSPYSFKGGVQGAARSAACPSGSWGRVYPAMPVPTCRPQSSGLQRWSPLALVDDTDCCKPTASSHNGFRCLESCDNPLWK